MTTGWLHRPRQPLPEFSQSIWLDGSLTDCQSDCSRSAWLLAPFLAACVLRSDRDGEVEKEEEEDELVDLIRLILSKLNVPARQLHYLVVSPLWSDLFRPTWLNPNQLKRNLFARAILLVASILEDAWVAHHNHQHDRGASIINLWQTTRQEDGGTSISRKAEEHAYYARKSSWCDLLCEFSSADRTRPVQN